MTDMTTEEVLAFVHDVRPWRDLDDNERTEWVRRIKHIRDSVTTDGKPWTNARIAGLFGLDLSGLEKRFSRSEAVSAPDPGIKTEQNKRSTVRQVIRQNPQMIADAIDELPPELAAPIVARLIERKRAAEPVVSEADRKAAEAGADQFVESFRDAVDNMDAGLRQVSRNLLADEIRASADEYRDMAVRGEVTSEFRADVQAALDYFSTTIMEVGEEVNK